MSRMTQSTADADSGSRPVRTAADAFVLQAATLNPLVATMLGLPEGQDELPDLSPGLHAAPRQAQTVASQLADWLATGDARGWFADFAAGAPADGPASLRSDLDAAAAGADGAVGELRDWLLREYLPAAAGTPDAVGEE